MDANGKIGKEIEGNIKIVIVTISYRSISNARPITYLTSFLSSLDVHFSGTLERLAPHGLIWTCGKCITKVLRLIISAKQPFTGT